MKLKGKIISGLQKAAFFVQLDWVQDSVMQSWDLNLTREHSTCRCYQRMFLLLRRYISGTALN